MIPELQSHWQVLRPLLVIHSEDEYDQAVEHMNQLIDEVGTDESHPLYELLDTLGTLIHAYEEEHYQIPAVSGIDTLRYLYFALNENRSFWASRNYGSHHNRSIITENDLKQSELPEIGSQGIVSEILSGKRTLNVRQIQALAQRFGVAPSVFFEATT